MDNLTSLERIKALLSSGEYEHRDEFHKWEILTLIDREILKESCPEIIKVPLDNFFYSDPFNAIRSFFDLSKLGIPESIKIDTFEVMGLKKFSASELLISKKINNIAYDVKYKSFNVDHDNNNVDFILCGIEK